MALVSGLTLVLATGGVLGARLAWSSRVERARRESDAGFDLSGSAPIGSRACLACHPDHTASWRATFHRTMTRDIGPTRTGPGPEPNVPAGPFDGRPYRYGTVEARPWRDDAGRFFMTFVSDEAPASPRTFEVTRAVGSHRYQQYFTQLGSAWVRLPLAYHIQEKRWLHMNGAFLTPDPPEVAAAPAQAPGVPAGSAASAGTATFGGRFLAYDRHVTRWNDNCIFCHNVGARPGWDASTGTFASHTDELGIACESCHGPGAAHAAANRDPLRRWSLRAAAVADPTIVNPARLSPGRAGDVCGHCHGQRITDDVTRFLTHGDPFIPGEDLGLYSAPLWASTPLAGTPDVFAARFWRDGTPRLSAYEYQGWLASRCSQVGRLTCTTCHGMHEGQPAGQLRPSARGDGACTGCHGELASAVPVRAGLSSTTAATTSSSPVAAHSRHPASVACVDCHMPRIVYGVMDVLRSHRIERPEPAAALAAGRPDACRLCHVDRDGAWARAARARLWGESAGVPSSASPRPELPAAASADTTLAWALGGDPITRAVALAALGRRDQGTAGTSASRLAVLAQALADEPYPALRRIAARSAGALVPSAAAVLGDFDPTGPVEARQRALAAWRTRLQEQGTVLPPLRALFAGVAPATLRLEADAQALDIGE